MAILRGFGAFSSKFWLKKPNPWIWTFCRGFLQDPGAGGGGSPTDRVEKGAGFKRDWVRSPDCSSLQMDVFCEYNWRVNDFLPIQARPLISWTPQWSVSVGQMSQCHMPNIWRCVPALFALPLKHRWVVFELRGSDKVDFMGEGTGICVHPVMDN